MGTSASAFAHLHVRSGFSWGQGTAMPEELVDRAANLCMASLALTDRNTVAGVPRLLKACADYGVSPIVGAEITVEMIGADLANNSATYRRSQGKGHSHVVVLAASEKGYQILSGLLTDYLCRPTRDAGENWPSAERL